MIEICQSDVFEKKTYEKFNNGTINQDLIIVLFSIIIFVLYYVGC